MDPFKNVGKESVNELEEEEEDIEGLEDFHVLSSLVESSQQPDSVVELNQPELASSNALSNILQKLKLPGKDITIQYLEGKLNFQEFTEILEKDEGEKMSAIDMEIDDADYSPIESNETEDDSPKKKKKGKQPRKARKRMTDLPKHLEGLMGEANMRFAKGEYDEAISMCSEIIRTAPKALQPFQTLAMIYEELGEVEKSMQFSLIAAYLRPTDADAWIRLAEMSLDKNDVNQAIKCYTHAIRADPSNTNSMWERCRLFEEIGDHRRALEGYITILKHLPEDEAEKYLQLARSVTKPVK